MTPARLAYTLTRTANNQTAVIDTTTGAVVFTGDFLAASRELRRLLSEAVTGGRQVRHSAMRKAGRA